MVRTIAAAALLLLGSAPAAADPDNVCGLEDASSTRTPCPPYVTYDEEGEEVGGAAG